MNGKQLARNPDGTNDVRARRGPLSGLRVLELGHYIAAPFCTRLLGDLGAEVIKVEPPGSGDPIRQWGDMVDGRSIWWSSHGRNKKCVTLNLKDPKGQDIVRRLVALSDVVVENFRPGQLEKFNLGPEELQKVRPGLVLVRISGFGQTGPDANKPSFGVIGESMGGIRYLTGYPPGVSDLPSVRIGISIGDSLSGMYGALGALSAIFEQRVAGIKQPIRIVDVALTESVLSLLEGILPEYSVLGKVRQPSGSSMPTAAPTNAYPVKDGKHILIAGNSDPLFQRLAKLIGRPELSDDPRFVNNPARVAHMKELDAMVSEWTRTQTREEALGKLDEARIPASKIYDAADIADDPQYRAREAIVSVADPAFPKPVMQPAPVPKFDSGAPGGGVGWPGPDIGAFNEEVYGELLGMDEAERSVLSKAGVI